MGEPSIEGYGVRVLQPEPCAVKGLATPILDGLQEMPNENEAIIVATVKCVSPADGLEESEQIPPARVLDWSTLVTLDGAGRPLLLKTMRARAADETWR